ncbi:calcium/proton exchanger [Colletotrichum abscissum]|uniref:Vacuolar calcium ion transporter n=1 Tax=Colletotrichum abscissum TaxID=1671311 RepID=A0A9P9X133_9PEZI|nr:calcium/proton exchanger [Colletotrichum abscissum]
MTLSIDPTVQNDGGPSGEVETRSNLIGRESRAENSPLLVSYNNRDPNETSNTRNHSIYVTAKYVSGVAVECLCQTWHVTKVSLCSSKLNYLLPMLPLSGVARSLHWEPTAVFAINFLAIIPLAAVLSFATEQVSVRCGKEVSALLNTTFGNAVEAVIGIVALRKGHIDVVQMAMLGSIISDLLLVTGMCFFLGGIVNMRHQITGQGTEQTFATGRAQIFCSLIALSSTSLLILTVLSAVLGNDDSFEKERSILVLSRGTAFILLSLYVLYLVFQLRTHPSLFEPETESPDTGNPVLSPTSAVAVLGVTTALVAFCADNLVESIGPVVEAAVLSKAFIGLIVVPFVGNVAKHAMAVVMATQDKMDVALGIAMGSSIQIALVVTPFLIIIAWVFGEPMTLQFGLLSAIIFLFSVLVIAYTVQDGRSNYLEGAMLLVLDTLHDGALSLHLSRFQLGGWLTTDDSKTRRVDLPPRFPITPLFVTFNGSVNAQKFSLADNPIIGLGKISKNSSAVFRVGQSFLSQRPKSAVFSESCPYDPLEFGPLMEILTIDWAAGTAISDDDPFSVNGLHEAPATGSKRSGEIEVLDDSDDGASPTKRPKRGGLRGRK